MLAEIGDHRAIRETDTTLEFQITVLLFEITYPAIIVDDKVVPDFQSFFLEHIFHACGIDVSIVRMIQQSDCMIQSDEKPSAFGKKLFQLGDFIGGKVVFGIDQAEYITIFISVQIQIYNRNVRQMR